ncbi:hypothetical protein LC040_03805 [Bacillus tianshenii]|nr:hypothetical protein LC040_03805 [Bacillus tianshenii]
MKSTSRLTPMQLEQKVIHLTSELNSIKTKWRRFKRTNYYVELKSLESQNQTLLEKLTTTEEEIATLKKQLEEKQQAKASLLQTKDHELEKLKQHYELEAYKLRTEKNHDILSFQKKLDQLFHWQGHYQDSLTKNKKYKQLLEDFQRKFNQLTDFAQTMQVQNDLLQAKEQELQELRQQHKLSEERYQNEINQLKEHSLTETNKLRSEYEKNTHLLKQKEAELLKWQSKYEESVAQNEANKRLLEDLQEKFNQLIDFGQSINTQNEQWQSWVQTIHESFKEHFETQENTLQEQHQSLLQQSESIQTILNTLPEHYRQLNDQLASLEMRMKKNTKSPLHRIVSQVYEIKQEHPIEENIYRRPKMDNHNEKESQSGEHQPTNHENESLRNRGFMPKMSKTTSWNIDDLEKKYEQQQQINDILTSLQKIDTKIDRLEKLIVDFTKPAE